MFDFYKLQLTSNVIEEDINVNIFCKSDYEHLLSIVLEQEHTISNYIIYSENARMIYIYIVLVDENL